MTTSRRPPRTPTDDRFSTEIPVRATVSPAANLLRGRNARRVGLGVLFWAAVFVMAVPAVSTGALPASALGLIAPTSHIVQPHIAPHAPTSAAASSISPSSTALPGANPRADTALTAADRALLQSAQPKFAALVGSASLTAPTATSGSTATSSPTVSSAAPAAPHPGYYIPTGSFYGYLYDQETGKAVVGATVQAYSVSGSNCPAVAPYCAPVATNSTGGFLVVAPVGFDYLSYSAPWYIGNVSYSTAGNGTKTNVGSIFIVESAIIKGIVRSDTPPHDNNLSGVQVSDAPVDLSYLLNPGGSTLTNGSFEVAGADAPSIVTFTPPEGLYLSNFTWTNASPGEVVNIGIVYLERLTEVKMNLTDASTGGPLDGLYASLQLCTLASGCGSTQQGITVDQSSHGPTVVTAFATPGADYAVIEATGYVLDQVTLPLVPKEAAGHVWWAPKQNLTPTGYAEVAVGMGSNDQQFGSGATAEASHEGLWTASVCTMSGLESIGYLINQRTGLPNTTKGNCNTAGCLSPGAETLVVAAPLRNYITVQPDTAGVCDGGPPTWLIPGYTPGGDPNVQAQVPVWLNETWFNSTPRLVTPLGWVNLTVGTYLEGNVTVQGTARAPSDGYSVTVSSLNYPSLTTYAFDSNGSLWAKWACGPEPPLNSPKFCAPAPPGPDLVTVQSVGFPNNFTWASAPESYQNLPSLVSLAQPTNVYDSQINLTAGGWITGNVTQNGTEFGVGLAGIEVCSIAPNYPVACTTGSTNLQGRFNFSAPLGWDYVKVAAAGYAPDFVWGYVNASFNTVHLGDIGLQPLARIEGTVVNPEGYPVLGANAEICPLTTPIGVNCPALGAGRVSSSGVYLGTVIGGWLPEATYRVQATAAGYTTNWAWVNATAGNLTNVSQIILYPSGSNASSAAPVGGADRGGASTAQVNTWLVGELVDNETGWGVETGDAAVCPAAGGPCDQIGIQGTDTGGFFNVTIPAGLYYLNVTAEGYQLSTTFFNSSGASYLNLGPIYLDPLPWVSGTTEIIPWGEIWTNISTNHLPDWVGFTMGPLASIQICTTALLCALTNNGGTSQNGSFLVWGEYGGHDSVKINPSAPAASTSAAGGFLANSTNITIPSGVFNTTIAGVIGLAIFASVSFSVVSNISWMTNSFGVAPPPVRYSTDTISAIGKNTAFVSTSANGAGNITFFIPPGNGVGTTHLSAQQLGEWESGTETFLTALEPGMAYTGSNLSLIHYGWEIGQALTTATFQPAAYLGVTAVSTPLHSAQIFTSTSHTNGAGFFNVSVAPAFSVKFTVGPGNDFNSVTFYAQGNYSNTSAYRSLDLEPQNVTVDHWGYYSSTQVNYSAFPVDTTVLDLVKGVPLPGASLVVATLGDNQSSSTALPQTNDQGQFFTDAPPGADYANFTRAVYQSNDSKVSILPSGLVTRRDVNLTGDGIIAARVVSEPGNTPVSGANITVCLGGQVVCGLAETNGSGVFWVNATPGTNWINISANGFIPAGPTLAEVCSDCFVSLPPIPVYEPAYIGGVVRGLPTGLPLYDANVSACSPLGTPTGPCLYTVQTHTTGSFLLQIPAGSYELAVQDNYFNATYLSINVHAGERVNVGTVFLEAFGAIAGSVYSNTTIGPIGGADVLACPVWSGSTCVGTSTSPNGRYLIQGAPGPYVITVSANGYEDFLVDATLVGGTTSVAPTAFMVPLGTGGTYPVSGVVDSNGAGFSGAIVAATTGGVVAASTATGSSGAFSMNVLYGTYTLLVSASGEAPVQLPLVVHGPVSGLVVTLSPQTYAVTGTVTDGLTGQPLAGVQILVGTTIVATTNGSGGYAVDLANGTYLLTADYAGSSSVNYAQEQVAVQVEGSGVARNIQMFPIETVVFGLVVDQASGVPLAGASVTVSGVATDGHHVTATLTTSPSGAFQLSLPQGSYSVTGTYGGYANQTVAFRPNGPSEPLTVSLVSTSGNEVSGTPASVAWIDLGVAAAAIALIAIVGLVLLTRRSGRGPSGGAP